MRTSVLMARAALVAALVCTAPFACAPRVTPPSVDGAPRETPVAIAPASPAPETTAKPEEPHVALGGLLPSPGCTPFAAPTPVPGAPLHTLEFLDIGQGDSELIQTASGKTVLVDSGDRDHNAALLADLAAAHVDHIDLLVATHPHLDHIGGMQAVLGKYPVRLYVDPGTDHPTETYKALLETVKKKNVPYSVLRAGKTLKLGNEATLTVLSPPADHLIQTERSPENANSIVMRLAIGSFSALYTGDAEPETLAALAPSVGHVDLLKVAHHGSHYGTNAAFLDAVHPEVATISLGAGNDYGHPHKETLSLLADRCVTTYRTDRDGTITLVTDGKGFRITTSKGTLPVAAVPGPSGDEAQAHGGAPSVAKTGPSPRAPAHASADVSGAVFASRRGKTFHPAGCAHLAKIKPENLVEFSSAAEAEAAGLHAARGCRPGGGDDVAPSSSGSSSGKTNDGVDDDAEGRSSKKRHTHRSR